MSRFSKVAAFALALVLAVSCGRSAKIDGYVPQMSSSQLVVKLLDINKFKVLDTVQVDKSGKFAYRFDVQKGQPEFVYLFNNETKIASLVLEGGDRVKIEADTSGNYTVEGSHESLKLAYVEREYAAALSRMNAIAARLEMAEDPSQALALRQELGKEYVDYYRSCVKYVMENSSSISVVPVFFQSLGVNLPVFSQKTDAIHFRNAADSLASVYPDSRYVKALRQEADRRFGYMELETRIRNAQEIGFPDIELPDLRGQKRKLSEVDAKVVILHMWTASDAKLKMFNLDMLLPLYNEFSDKGLEIYQVAFDVDKGLWAQVVKEQGLPWINVCDSRGKVSPFASSYNVQALPATYIIADGQLVDGAVVDGPSLRRLLKKLL